tara:strand:- start:901 stop:1185 length:285 start_codon:yes stop_codon:yes gene_type:complete
MNTNFTKAPWSVLGEIVIAEGGHKTIKPLCSLNGRISPQEDEANAHLIAAAPDMYEMLKELSSISENYQESIIFWIHENKYKVEELLAKAQGEI